MRYSYIIYDDLIPKQEPDVVKLMMWQRRIEDEIYNLMIDTIWQRLTVPLSKGKKEKEVADIPTVPIEPAVEPPPTSYSFDIIITPIDEVYSLMIDTTKTISPQVVNLNQPQQLLQAFGQMAVSGLATLTRQPTFAWAPGTWRITVQQQPKTP